MWEITSENDITSTSVWKGEDNNSKIKRQIESIWQMTMIDRGAIGTSIILSLSHSLSLSFCLSASVFLCLSLSLSKSLFLPLCLCLSLSLSLSLSLCLSLSLYVSLCISLSLSVSVSLCLSLVILLYFFSLKYFVIFPWFSNVWVITVWQTFN